ncbi:MAG TPA: glycoside hydrolase family 2 TIM barrel-domain containing protein [Flavisolibacter sp.]|nr:glycoside hydrolase family 2 TIM barrel-domain containing protein [Flavisolibacter sp.]
MKNKCGFLSPALLKMFCFLLAIAPFISINATVKYTINEGWRFSRDHKESYHLPDWNDSKWETINIPHTWNNKDAADDQPGYYRGIGWYRKAVFIDSSSSDRITSLYFDGANQTTTLYVNGKLVGTHKGGYARFSFDISKYIIPGTYNLFAIKVDNSHDVAVPPLTADFTFFGGIYRNLYLVVKEKTSFSISDYASDGIYIRTPSVSDQKAQVETETLLDNYLDAKRKVLFIQTVLGPDGKEIFVHQQQLVLQPGSFKISHKNKFTIDQPFLWSPEAPHLYTLKTVIIDAQSKKELDMQFNTFGLRWFSFDSQNGFSLNGKQIKLIGTNRHQCFLEKGNALPDEFHIADIRLLKEMGGNMLRIAHYPQDPLILAMCDKLGIITSVEVPIVNEITESQEFLQNSLQMTEEMVKQSFNHPSVVIWAYMNEVMLRPPFLDDSTRHKQYCREVNRQANEIESLLRKLDADRYTMIPLHGSLKSYEDAGLVNLPRLVGWNLYQGWYGGVFADFDTFLSKYHAKYPTMPILITEYGADVDDRLHSFKPERFDFTVEYGDLYHEHYLKTILQNKYISGGTIWNLNDFYSESRTDAIPHVNTKGITTRARGLKNTYLLYKVLLAKTPLAYIGSKSWKYRAGTDDGNGSSKQPIKIYSNLETVDIFHNGAFFKRVSIPDQHLQLDLPFTAGKNSIELRADSKTYDFAEFEFTLHPGNLQNSDFSELNVLLGSNRYFEDRDARIVWVPEQPYTPGSWGYIGGSPVRPKTKSGKLPATSVNILNTENDPIFQTQRQGLQSFKLDVKEGQYAVYLYWADLANSSDEKLVYNLDNNTIDKDRTKSIMNVQINSVPVFSNFNSQHGMNAATAIVKKIQVNVVGRKGITVDLQPVEGNTVLNAIRVVKLN